MNAYPSTGPCLPVAYDGGGDYAPTPSGQPTPSWSISTDNATLGAICYERGGSCIEGRAVCKCPLYYDPLNDCSITAYAAEHNASIFYVTYGYAWVLVCFILVSLEIANDYATERVNRRTKVFYAKVATLLWCPFKAAGISFWLYGLVTDSAEHATHETMMNMVALAIFQASFMLSAVYWFELIETAKHIWTDVPSGVVVCKRIVLGMVIFILFLIINHSLVQYGIAPAFMGTIGTVGLFGVIIITFVIDLVQLIRARSFYAQFEREAAPDPASGTRHTPTKARKFLLLKHKTNLLFANTILFIFTASIGLSTYLLPTDIPLNMILGKILIVVHESTNGILGFLFLENGLRTRYRALRAMIAPSLFDSDARRGDSSTTSGTTSRHSGKRQGADGKTPRRRVKGSGSNPTTSTDRSLLTRPGGQSTSSTVPDSIDAANYMESRGPRSPRTQTTSTTPDASDSLSSGAYAIAMQRRPSVSDTTSSRSYSSVGPDGSPPDRDGNVTSGSEATSSD